MLYLRRVQLSHLLTKNHFILRNSLTWYWLFNLLEFRDLFLHLKSLRRCDRTKILKRSPIYLWEIEWMKARKRAFEALWSAKAFKKISDQSHLIYLLHSLSEVEFEKLGCKVSTLWHG